MITFTKHAVEKFDILLNHGFHISRRQVVKTVIEPDILDFSRLPLLIAQRKIDKAHVLRVVYKVEDKTKKIITFYPGRVKQYE